MASRTLLLPTGRRHVLLKQVVRKCGVRRLASSSSKAALVAASERIHQDNDYAYHAWGLAATAAAGLAYTQERPQCAAKAAVASSWGAAATEVPPSSSSSKHAPRNVMLHPRRSIRARNLEDKYNVEWDIILGEGAYGSVHPARLAATGEKVCFSSIRFARSLSS